MNLRVADVIRDANALLADENCTIEELLLIEERLKEVCVYFEESKKRREAALSFSQINMKPNGKEYPEAGHSAVNAIALTENISWREAYGSLLKQAHRLCCLPNEEKCIHAMLEDHGFIRQPDSVQAYSPEELFIKINESCTSGASFLLRSNKFGRNINTVLIDPDPNKEGYRTVGEAFPSLYVKELWVRWPDGQDHSPIPRRKRKTAAKARKAAVRTYYKNHESYRYYLATPEKILQGDCVVRAISAVCALNWHEAVDALAACQDYKTTVLNDPSVFSRLLESKGFVRHNAMKRNGRSLTGKEFCRELEKTYHSREPVFAYSNPSHVVAIRADDGRNYRIMDSWDSSDRKIGEYWVKPQRKPR